MKQRTQPRVPLRTPAKIYLTEWMRIKEVGDEELAKNLGVARETVTRYRSYPNRMNYQAIVDIARALNIPPGQLWCNPERPSLDALTKDLDDLKHKHVVEMVRLFLASHALRSEDL